VSARYARERESARTDVYSLAAAAGSCARTEISMRSTQTKDKATKAKDEFTSEKMDAIIDLW
jgi:hypothetical protein